ncbi:gliding motility-associated C-terminal domain-containing protein [Capnocytophaga bilenii]
MKAILTAVIAMLVSVGTAQTVVSNNVLTKRICYVKKDAKGSNNGENWQDALTELSTALDFAKAHQKEFTEKEPLQIWVAGSANYSYSPKVGDGITADKATFAMVKNVKIYGGFAGNETALLQRNWYANPTILSGRVNNAGVAHIGRLITSEGAMGVATLDGFRLKYAAPINGKKGVAIYVANGSSRFENCAITDNLFGSEALIYVKGTERERATPIFINLQVSDNTPKKEDIIGDNVDDNIDQPNNGADGLVMTPWAMENDQYADTQLINATFYNNGGNDLKIAPSASPKIYNTILLERVDGNFKNIDVQYSMVNGALSGNGNIPVESPAGIFVSLSKDDKYYLRPKRSLINAGNGGLYRSKSDNDFDLAHMPRIMEGGIDIGAYEFYKDYESICNEIPTPKIVPDYYGNSCDGGGMRAMLSNYTDYQKINERGATYKVYDHQGKEVPYMGTLIQFYSGIININQEGLFKLVVSYNGCEKESDWFQIYYSRGAGRPGIPSLKHHPATCDSNSWEEILNYDESKYSYKLLKDNGEKNTIKDKKLVGLEQGSYELKVYNKNSYDCYSSYKFTIEGRKTLDAPTVEPLPAECGKKGKGYITQFDRKLTYQLLLNGKVLRKLNSAEFTADAGSYQVVVRNANGCVATSATFVIEEAKKIPLKPDVWVDAPACGVSGKAIIKNYDRNLTYKLSNGASTKLLGSAEINEAGEYTLLVYNGSCDSEEVHFTVAAAKEGAVAPVVRTTSATCGEIGKAYIEGYDSNLRYRLVALSATGAVVKSSDINGAAIAVAAGSYKVEVRKANGCVATSATFVIEEAKKIPLKPDVWVDAPACGVSGKAIIKNYDRNLTYKLNNGASTKLLGSAEISEAGKYTLEVSNGTCSSEEVHFTVAAAKENVTAPKVTTTSATCGEIGKARIDNYNEKLTYQLVALSATGAAVKSSAINTANLSMTAGTYQVVVRNTNDCVATSTTFVIEEAKKIPQKPDVWVDAPACGVSGKAIIKNYDLNLTYKLNNGASTKLLGSAEINEPGKYTLLVNNGSCDSEEVQFVVEPAKEGAVAPVVRTTSATCGEIGKAYIEGYDSNLRYRLVALSATGAVVKSSDINGAAIAVAAGSYKVEVRKANGCVATSATFVIEEAKKIPALPKIDFITEAACGVANDIRIRDYDKNFSYTLISKSGARKPVHSLHIEATEGTYQLEVSNGDCAVTTSEFHIGEEKVLPAKPELRVLPATCGGVTDVLIKNYDNSLNYELLPAIAGNEILSNGVISATANKYIVKVSNGSCTAQSDSFEIKAQLLPPAEPTIKEEVAATCAAPSLVRISNYDPTLQYKLSPAGEILQDGVISATVGRYIVIATNSNGCSANSSIFVINPQKEAPAQPKITVYNASCGTKGGAVIRNYRGDYTYSFTPEATITAGGVISATAGKYQLKVSNGTCEATAVSFEIEAERAIPAQPTVIVTAPDCDVAGSAHISNYDPQLSYTILPKREGYVVLANGVISVTAGGSYNVVVSNGYCKKSSEVFTIEKANTIPATPIVVTTSATCGEIGKARIANYDRRYTDKYVLTPSGRVHYDGTIIAGAGNYVLSVNNGSCKVSTAFTIEAEKAMPQAPAIVTTPATCGEAGSAKITNYDSNFTYTLLEGNKSTVLDNAVISVGEGVYRVSVTNAAGCQVISREFSIQAAKVISEKPVVITQAAICGEEGSAYVANYNPIYQYTVFPNGSVDANGNIKASKNIFTYVTAHYKGCSATSEGFTIQPKLNGVEQPEILLIPGGCGAVGFARITNFNPDYEYEVLPTGTITPDGRVMAPPTNTYYRVRAFYNGCAATSENFRLQPSTSGFEKPVLSVAKENCNMGTIAFVKNYNKEYTYTVHPFGGVTKDTGILVFPENSVTHTFSVTVTASNGVCQSTSDAVLIIPERSYQPRVAIVARTCDSEGAAYITNYNPAYRYVFTDPLLSVTDAGVIVGAQPELVYAVAARTPDDCSSKETVFSIRNECENEVPCKIEIFNAVSANNDDANDFFYIKNIECYPSNKVYIFNSQGKVVFEQQNYDNSHRSFRGISNTEGAQLLPSGTYFYILKYADKRGRETDERGYLYLKGRH